MIGFLLGICCGAVELYLLWLLVSRVIADLRIPLWILPVKVLVLAVFCVPYGWFYPDQLSYMGFGIAGVLIIGALIIFILRKRRKTIAAPQKEDCAT